MTNTFDLADYGEMYLFAKKAQQDGHPRVLIDPEHACDLIDEVSRLQGEKRSLVAALDAIHDSYEKVDEHLSLHGDPMREPAPDDLIRIPYKLLDALHWSYKAAMFSAFSGPNSPGRRGIEDSSPAITPNQA